MSMRTVQTTEAKTRLAELLRTVEKGETVAITRRGHMIAHIVPISGKAVDASHRRAMKRFLRRLDKLEPCSMNVEDIASARNKGRHC